MTNTQTSIHFNQYYFDASTPAPDDAGRITVGTEANWTSNASTRDAFMSLQVAQNSNLNEKIRITSAGKIGINTSTPASTLHIVPDSASAVQIDPFGTGGGQTGELRLLELAANGANYVGFKAPDELSGNQIYVLPAAIGSPGQFLKLDDANGVLAWDSGAGGGGLGSLEDDTTPSLGGNLDVNGFAISASSNREYIKFSPITSAVNEITVTHAATGNGPKISATGDDVDISLTINSKGTGSVVINTAEIDSSGVMQTHVGKQTLWIPAGAMRSTVSNGADGPNLTETTAGSPDLETFDFDASADEHVQFSIAFPKSWDEGTVTFQAYWTSAATDTDGVAWALQGVGHSRQRHVGHGLRHGSGHY